MKLLAISDKARILKYAPDLPIVAQTELVALPRGTDDDTLLAAASDADFIFADAVSPISERLISSMPNLKIIQSEGVGYNMIDLEAARARGVFVCNSQGVNAGSVAEQAILLMLACLRDVVRCDAAVREGHQIQMKEQMMLRGFRELGTCKVGFIGFGNIARAAAKRLAAWDCTLAYNDVHPLSDEENRMLHVAFEDRAHLLATCDIVSIHVPVFDSTRNMVNADFLAAMKPTAYLINTARGELVDNQALANALISGTIAGAGLDTIAPEPVTPENVLLNLPSEAAAKLVLSPHIGGVSEDMFYRGHRWAWENFARIAAGETPLRVVS